MLLHCTLLPILVVAEPLVTTSELVHWKLTHVFESKNVSSDLILFMFKGPLEGRGPRLALHITSNKSVNM